MTKKIPRIIITPGEPAGIGPDITLQLAQTTSPAELIIVGDPALFRLRAEQLKLPITLQTFDSTKPAMAHVAGELKIIPIELNAPCEPGHLNVRNAKYVLRCLDVAVDYCLQKKPPHWSRGPCTKALSMKQIFHLPDILNF